MTTLAQDRARRRTAIFAALMALSMIGLAYASVPLYQMFCQVTGFGGTTNRAAAVPGAAQVARVHGRTIKVRFDANVQAGMPWRFAPRTRSVTIPIGEKRLAFYEVQNLSGQPTTGRAVFNVSPDSAGRFFTKIDCFCFTEQTVAPGETVQMPVSYFIDPAILDDPDAHKIDEITLSYTFYPVDKPSPPAVGSAAIQSRNNRG